MSTAPLNLVRDNKTGVITRAATAGSAAEATPTAAVHANYTTTSSTGQPVYAVTPADLATIYNFAGLLSAGTNGTGQSIAVVGDSDIDAADFVDFRTLFNLPIGITTTPTNTQYLNIVFNGPDPGTTPDEVKADAATQWAGAVAPNATIDYVISESTSVSQGSDLSAQYIVDNNLAPILIDSFNLCEASAGASLQRSSSAASGSRPPRRASASSSRRATTARRDATPSAPPRPPAASPSTPSPARPTMSPSAAPTSPAAGARPTIPTSSSAPGYLIETAWNDNLGPQAMGPIVRGGSGGASSCATGSGASCAGVPQARLADRCDRNRQRRGA